VKTIREFSRYVENLRNFILNEYEKGTKEFYIKGDGEILNLIEFVFKTIEIPQIKWKNNLEIKNVFDIIMEWMK